MSEPRRQIITVKGVRLSYLEWGVPGSGLVSLLCLHGLMATAETFGRLVHYLPAACHVIALDLPGNGASDNGLALSAGFAGLAELVGAFASAVALVNPVVVGHSHGGALALRMAASHPGSLRGLVLLCPAHPFSGHEESLVRFYRSPVGHLSAHLIPRLPKALQRFGFQQMLGSGSSAEPNWFEPYHRNLRRPGTVTHLLRLLESWQTDMEQMGVDLQRRPLSLPALLIWGGEDNVVPAATGPALVAHIPGAESAILPGIGHLPNEEAPERCGQLISEWLARLG